MTPEPIEQTLTVRIPNGPDEPHRWTQADVDRVAAQERRVVVGPTFDWSLPWWGSVRVAGATLTDTHVDVTIVWADDNTTPAQARTGLIVGGFHASNLEASAGYTFTHRGGVKVLDVLHHLVPAPAPPAPKWGDLWGIDPDYTRGAPAEVALPADDTPEHTLLVQELAEIMVRARAAYTGPGFSTWPTAMHAQAAAAITHLRGETP